MTRTKHSISGAWHLSAMLRGYFIERTYYGFTRSEARAAFREYLAGLTIVNQI